MSIAKKFNNILIFSILLSFILSVNLSAQQIRMPAPSPLSEVKETVGLTDVSIVYSRPSMKERVIFGDLVPYGKLWRTGANMATKISFSEDVKIEGRELAAGSYSFFTIPGESEWTLIFNTVADQPGAAQYDESKDALRVTVKSDKMPISVETLMIGINSIRNDHAYLMVAWENTIVGAKIEVNTDEAVMASIERAMDPSSDAGKYWAAANYYYETDRDMDKALEWVNKSIELGNNRFWVVHMKAKIQHKMGDCSAAVA
ncbi:MAG: DUF2911 domain-containing protein, partial [Cyclobacteriaceae bacterium]